MDADEEDMFGRQTRRQALLGVAGLLAAGLAPAAMARPRITVQGVALPGITSIGNIPRGYRNYVLFLGTSYDHLRLAGTAETTLALSRQFKSFGDAIGARALAVFVGEPQTARFNVAAGRTMLDGVKRRYGLRADYQDGPFLVVLNGHPSDRPNASGRASVIGFRGYSNTEIQSLLVELRREIAAAQRVQPDGIFHQLLQGILIAWNQTGNPLASRLAISVAGG